MKEKESRLLGKSMGFKKVQGFLPGGRLIGRFICKLDEYWILIQQSLSKLSIVGKVYFSVPVGCNYVSSTWEICFNRIQVVFQSG